MASPAAGIDATGPQKSGGQPAGRVGSEDLYSTSLQPAREAAVLYAANHATHAESILRSETRNPATLSNKQPWLMLFDLFEVTQNRAEYDALSPLYAARFEHPPPAWASGAAAVQDPRRTQGRERKDLFVLKPDAAGELAQEIEKLVAFAESMRTVRLELGKVDSITTRQAALLGAALQRLRRANMPTWFNNAAPFERILRTALNERPTEATRSYWSLLFELFMLQCKREAFVALGLEYAVAFGTSPPAWEEYVNSVAAASNAPAPAAADSGFAMKGVISAASQDQLAELATHAASGAEIVVDMGKVLRIDFAAGAQFFEAVKAIQLAGKRVILANLSELNAALLEAFGFNRHAILIRRNTH